MKICHVINDLSRGGAESHLYSLVTLQVEKGYDISILLLGKDLHNFVTLENEFESLDLKLNRLKGPKKFQGINPFSIYKAIGYFKKNKFDIVHTHTPRSDFLAYSSNLFLKNKGKRIVTIHGKYGTYLQGNFLIDSLRKVFIRQQSKIWKKASKVIVISESIKEWLEQLNSSIKPMVIPYGVEIPKAPHKDKLTNPTIGYLGKLNKNKGIEDLIDVYTKFQEKENSSNFELNLLIGGVGSENYVKSLKNKNKDNNIKFLGYVEDRYNFFKSIEIFVFPSYSEGLGLVLLEAMAHGVVCITRDVTPMNSIVDNEENGFLFNDNKELLEIIEMVLNLDSTEKNKLIQSALEKIEKSYSIMQMYLSIEKAYN
tara:strand:+ start:2131 stop:3237 length:1107 start_codon:yes stop_codon:yes gene_type:complete